MRRSVFLARGGTSPPDTPVPRPGRLLTVQPGPGPAQLRLFLGLLLTLPLLAAPVTTRAQKAGPARPPESLVRACLARCQEESTRCNRDAREAHKTSKTSGRAKPRGRGLRQCGCAFLGCKQMCRRYALGYFRCSGSTRPRPPPRPNTRENACKRDRDCVLTQFRSPCSCAPCGVSWLRAVNKKTLHEWKSSWARRRCAARRCPPCDRWVIGSGAHCLDGRCRVQP
jgi:hypothetical protein